MDFTTALAAIVDFVVKKNPWILVHAVVIWLSMRLIQSDIKYVPTVPARFRIFCLPVFTLASVFTAYYGQEEFGHTITWLAAILGSLAAAAISVYFHEAVVEAIRKGKAIPIPFLTIPGAKPTGAAPATISATPGDQKTPPADPPEPNPPA